MTESIGLILIFGGLLFDFSGCLGLIRLPDVYNRLQSSTKCVTLGTCLILLGTIFYTGLNAIGIKAILCVWFILMTSPTAAHAISRASHRSGYRLWHGSVCDQYLEDRQANQKKKVPEVSVKE